MISSFRYDNTGRSYSGTSVLLAARVVEGRGGGVPWVEASSLPQPPQGWSLVHLYNITCNWILVIIIVAVSCMVVRNPLV